MGSRDFETPDRIDALKRRPKTEGGKKAAESIRSLSDIVGPELAALSRLAIGSTPPALAVFHDGTYNAYESGTDLKSDLDNIDETSARTGGIARLVMPGDALTEGK